MNNLFLFQSSLLHSLFSCLPFIFSQSAMTDTTSTVSKSSFLLHHFTTPITLKLIHGLSFFHFLQGTDVPSRFLPSSDASAAAVVNPEYTFYVQQDHLLVARMFSSM